MHQSLFRLEIFLKEFGVTAVKAGKRLSLIHISASAGIYTLVETAKANGLDAMKYIKYILADMPGSRSVSYTHLDVYKRQATLNEMEITAEWGGTADAGPSNGYNRCGTQELLRLSLIHI